MKLDYFTATSTTATSTFVNLKTTGEQVIPHSTTLPTTCEVGAIYQDTDATSGQQIYACESVNTWVLQGDGGGSAVGARAYHDASQSISNSSATSLALNQERYDTDTIHDLSTNNSRLTAPSDGYYHIEGNVGS